MTDYKELIETLRAAASGLASLKNDLGDYGLLEDAADALEAATTEPLQARVKPWMDACFGPEISADRLERGDRLLEEVLELLQSGGYPKERIARLVEYTFSRPKGEPAQEVGGVMITLAAYCLAHELDMHEAGETELARIWTKIEVIRAKQAEKPTGSALPQEWPATAEQVAVVKPLVWEKEHGDWSANTDFGQYLIIRTWHDMAVLSLDGKELYRGSDGGPSKAMLKAEIDHLKRSFRSAADVVAEARAAERAKVIALIESYPASGHGHLPSDPYDAARQVRSEILSALHTPESLAVKEGKA